MIVTFSIADGSYSLLNKLNQMNVNTGGLSDEELVKRCQTELPYITDGFEILVNRFKDKVFSRSLAMLRNRQDAEDVSQDIFIKIFDALPKFEMRSSLNTWITAITINTCLTHIDKRKRKPWWWLTEDIDEIEKSQKEERNLFLMITRSSEQEDIREAIQLTLKKMNAQSNEIIKLRFFEEMDYQSIADRLKIKLSAAKMRLKRAREEFIEKYQEVNKEV